MKRPYYVEMNLGNRSPSVFQPSGGTLQQVILCNSNQLYSPRIAQEWNVTTEENQKDKNEARKSFESANADVLVGDESNCCNKLCWWSPKLDSNIVAFCSESSIHGLQFLGQPKRHMIERIFWAMSFLLSILAAAYLIHAVWDTYRKEPVTVSFVSSEVTIDETPFPAVTICNMNKFSGDSILELKRIAKEPTNPKYNKTMKQLKYVRSVCKAQLTLESDMDFGKGGSTESKEQNETITAEEQAEMIDFIMENYQPCEKLIRWCRWAGNVIPCSNLFKPIITEYGQFVLYNQGCTFNILPLPLLLKNPNKFETENSSAFDNPVLGTHRSWDESELKEWSRWDYDAGSILPTYIRRPLRQQRAGMPHGLSILVDLDNDNSYCKGSDSNGVQFNLHNPMEMPHVMEFSSFAGVEKEVLVEIHTDVTKAHDDIREIVTEKRQCYFGKEETLSLFDPYTGGNCREECTASILAYKCNCSYFYLPRVENERICNTDRDSRDQKCIRRARVHSKKTLDQSCGNCEPLCDYIEYNYETTSAENLNVGNLWNSVEPENRPNSAAHQMTVLHFFHGKQSIVPKLRKRRHAPVELIANSGGILGLCLGFSILSGVELIYFMTLRSFCKCCRNWMARRSVRNSKFKSEKVIRVDPKRIPVYPAYPHDRKEN